MGVPAPSKPYHHGNLREAFLRAAERALEANGAGQLSLRELSRELGVSHTAPRRHFADKQQLLDALAREGYEQLRVVFEAAAGDAAEDFTTRLTRLGQAYVAFGAERPAMLSLMFESKHKADAPADLLEAAGRAFGAVPRVIAEGQEAGEVEPGDPAILGLVTFATLQGMIALSHNGLIKGAPLGVMVGKAIERLVLGLQPRPKRK